MAFPTYLITPKQLHTALQKSSSSSSSSSSRIIPLCASWFLPNDPQKRTGASTFRAARIPRARFLDIDAVKDDASPYPHMLPTASHFARAMSELGIHARDDVVVYDSAELGIFSAPRVGWMLRALGHPGGVHVLDNFRAWVEMGLPTERGESEVGVQRSEYPVPSAEGVRQRVVGFEEMKGLAEGGCRSAQVLDARPYGRWAGRDPEPRPGLSSGHVPGSVSVPFTDVLDPETKTFLSKEKLRELFRSKGVDESRPVVSSCGTGVTAAVVDAALEEAFGRAEAPRRIYDGSWTEWAQRVSEDDGLIEKSS